MAKKLDDILRKKWVEILINTLSEMGEEVIQYKPNEICIPTLDDEDNEKFIQFVVKVPKGSRDGEEFDGYAMKEEYEIKLKEKAEKAKKDAEKKAKKIERDKKLREKKINEKEE